MITLELSQQVRILSGPFRDIISAVHKVDEQANTVTVALAAFPRTIFPTFSLDEVEFISQLVRMTSHPSTSTEIAAHVSVFPFSDLDKHITRLG